MSMRNRKVLGCLGAIGLALGGTGTLVFLNWDTASKNLIEAWDTQAASTEARLFRWGELMSIGAQLKARYGVEPDVTYDTSTGVRTLGIRFRNYQMPGQVTIEGHAREVATLALAETTKFDQIDAVTVLFQDPPTKGGVEATDGSATFTFSRADLMPSQPKAKPEDPGHSASE